MNYGRTAGTGDLIDYRTFRGHTLARFAPGGVHAGRVEDDETLSFVLQCRHDNAVGRDDLSNQFGESVVDAVHVRR